MRASRDFPKRERMIYNDRDIEINERLEQQDNRCFYCGKELKCACIYHREATRDHWVPQSLWWQLDEPTREALVALAPFPPTNWVVACTGCNRNKGSAIPTGAIPILQKAGQTLLGGIDPLEKR